MGRAAIMESYREAGEAARSEFAQITYLSDVTAVADGLARINFCDQLCHHGLSFTFECQQVIEVDPDGLIRRILHVDLPDQREALEEFRRRVAEASASDEANRLTDRCRSTDHE